MDRSTQGRVVAAGFCGAMLVAVESAAAALPVAGARFAVHDHATKGAAWHAELERSLRRFDHEDVPNQLHESQPCPQ